MRRTSYLMLFLFICCGAVLNLAFMLLVSFNYFKSSCQRVCPTRLAEVSLPAAGTVNSISPGEETATWAVHSILTTTVDRYHHAIIRSIMHHARPTILYLHVPNSTAFVSSEFETRLYDEYANIEIVKYSGSVLANPSFSEIRKLVSPLGSGVYISLSVFPQPPMRTLLATHKCLVDKQRLVILLHTDCPYFGSSNVSSEYSAVIASDDPTDETAAAVMVSPSVFHRLRPFTTGYLLGPDKHWNLVVQRSLEPVPHPRPVMPNIVHYVWFSVHKEWKFSFMQLISVLSNLRINRVDKVLIHSNVPPSGRHWDWLRQRYGDRIQRRYHPQVRRISGVKADVNPEPHASDIVRLLMLKRFGGMYFDWDAIALKSHDHLRHYDAVMGANEPFSDALANGHIMFSSDSEFLRLYLNNYRQYDPNSWQKNSLEAPKEILSQYPYLLKVPDKFLLSPRHEVLTRIYDGNLTFGMTDYYAFHYCSPEPEYYFKFELDFESIHRINGTFGQILALISAQP